jgi:hypothetical protein
VSVKQLEIDLERCGGDCPAAAKQLYGLGRIDGYVLDTDRLVALRAAAHRYDQVEGNTGISTPPGLTVNPPPQTIAALYRVASGSPAGFVSRSATCRAVQDLIVYGMPFDAPPSAIREDRSDE